MILALCRMDIINPLFKWACDLTIEYSLFKTSKWLSAFDVNKTTFKGLQGVSPFRAQRINKK